MAFITGIPIRNSIHPDTGSDIGEWKKYRAELTGLYVTGDGTGAMYEQYASQDFREYNKKVNDLGLSGNILMEPMDEGFRFTNNPILGAYTGSVGAFSTRGLGFGGPILRVRRKNFDFNASNEYFGNSVSVEADVRLDKNGEVSFDSPVENYSIMGDWMNTHTTGFAGNPVVVRESTMQTNFIEDPAYDDGQKFPLGLNQTYEFKTVDCTFLDFSGEFATGIEPFSTVSDLGNLARYFAYCVGGSLFEDLPTDRGKLTNFWPPITQADIDYWEGDGQDWTTGQYGEGDLSGMQVGVGVPESTFLGFLGIAMAGTWYPNGRTGVGGPQRGPDTTLINYQLYIANKGGALTPPNTSRVLNYGMITPIAEQKMRWIIDARFPEKMTLGEFLGTDSQGYVTTWYDQSATGSARNNLVQATAAKQPLLVDSGAFITDTGGNKCLQFDGGDALYFDTGFAYTINISGLSSFTVFQSSGTAGTQLISSLGSFADSNKRWYSPIIEAGEFRYSYGANNPITSAAETINTNINLVSLCADTGQGDARAFRNGSQIGGTATLEDKDGGTTTVGVGAMGDNHYFAGKIHEFMVFQNQTTSTHRTKIEEDINNHFDIY